MKKLKINFSFVVLCVVCFITKQFGLIVNYFLALLLHEFAHLYIAVKRGYKLKEINISIFGVCVDLDNELDNKDSFAVNIAGPMCNLILCIVCFATYWLVPQSYNYLNCFCNCNLVLALFNMLPIYPLDGGKVFYNLIKNKKVYKWLDIIIRVLLCATFVILFICSLKHNINWFYLIFAVFFVISYSKPQPSFSLFKLKRHKRIERVVLLKAEGEDSLINLLKQIKNHHYTIFYCNQTKSKYFDEDTIIKLSTSYPLTTKLQDIN